MPVPFGADERNSVPSRYRTRTRGMHRQTATPVATPTATPTVYGNELGVYDSNDSPAQHENQTPSVTYDNSSTPSPSPFPWDTLSQDDPAFPAKTPFDDTSLTNNPPLSSKSADMPIVTPPRTLEEAHHLSPKALQASSFKASSEGSSPIDISSPTSQGGAAAPAARRELRSAGAARGDERERARLRLAASPEA